LDFLFEDPTPVLKAIEHVKTGTRWSQENYIAGIRSGKRSRDRVVHVGRVFKWRCGSQFFFDRRSVFSNQDHFAHAFADQLSQRLIRRLLPFAAED
jgi:hypothetical protein